MKVVLTSTGELKEPSVRVRLNGKEGPDGLDYLYLDLCGKAGNLATDENGFYPMTDEEWEDLLDTFRLVPLYWKSLLTNIYSLFPGTGDGTADISLVFREDE